MKRKAMAMRKILIVDGYNVINVRKPIRESEALEDARRELTERLHDYAGRTGQEIILVYDAWLSDRLNRSTETRDGLTVVFTRKGETADHYIERTCDALRDDIEMRRAEVRVATSDLVEQTVSFGRGAVRLSSRELLLEMDRVRSVQGGSFSSKSKGRTTVADHLPPEIREKLARMAKGEM